MKTLITIILFFLVLTFPVNAHKVVVFAWVEDGKVNVEAGFGSGKKAKNCKVEIKDAKGGLLATARTDMEGTAFFQINPDLMQAITIFVDAGQGHKGFWKIPKEEMVQSKINDHEAEGAKKPRGTKPSVLKILIGVGVIFGLFLALSIVHRRKKHSND